MEADFTELYDKYFDDVYRYVSFKISNKWDVDDIVSNIFRKAFEGYGRVQSNSKAWLFTIARNTVTDFYRKKKDIVIGDDLDLYDYPNYFEDNIDKEDELKCLKESLYKLSKDELEIVNLRYFSDMKYAEIGQMLDKSENAVKVKASRIKKKLAELVKVCLEG